MSVTTLREWLALSASLLIVIGFAANWITTW